MSSATTDILIRASRGQATFSEVAQALSSIEHLTILIQPGEFRRFMADVDAATRTKGAGSVTVHDTEAPAQVGILTQGGFVPQVFTDDDLARRFAVATGIIAPDEAMAMTMARPVDFLHDVLARGCPGMILDDQSPQKINLHRPTVARLYALLARDAFAASEATHVVTLAGEILYQRQNDKPGLQAFVFGSEDAARLGLPEIRTRAAEIDATPVETVPLLEAMLRAGVTALIVNPGLPTAHQYDHDDLVAMVAGASAIPGSDL